MGVIAHNEEDVKLLARLMRAEAEGEGQQGMLMVGNVGVNRVRGNCLDFKNIRNLRQMVYQNPGGFEATQKDIFISVRVNKILLWQDGPFKGSAFGLPTLPYGFRPEGACPPTWYNQQNSGRFKSTASSSQMLGIALAYIK